MLAYDYRQFRRFRNPEPTLTKPAACCRPTTVLSLYPYSYPNRPTARPARPSCPAPHRARFRSRACGWREKAIVGDRMRRFVRDWGGFRTETVRNRVKDGNRSCVQKGAPQKRVVVPKPRASRSSRGSVLSGWPERMAVGHTGRSDEGAGRGRRGVVAAGRDVSGGRMRRYRSDASCDGGVAEPLRQKGQQAQALGIVGDAGLQRDRVWLRVGLRHACEVQCAVLSAGSRCL